MSMPVYTVLSKAIVVDLVLYRVASVDVYQEIAAKQQETGLPISWVAHMNEYSNYNKIMQSIMCGDNVDLTRIEYFIGRQPTDVEIDAIAIVGKMRVIVSEMLHKPEPDYTFAKIPAGKALTDILSLKKTSIFRGSYQIGYKTAKKVWEHARDYWKSVDQGKQFAAPNLYISASGYHNKNVVVFNDRIEIGCQRIERWVVEQLAVNQGWV
jgi:hypothetical protein